VPIVHLSGWYDPYARTAMANYVGLSNTKRSGMQLILGPWTHGDRSLSYTGEVEFGPAAPVDGNLAGDFFDLRRRWFDRWIKGIANGVDEEPAVRVPDDLSFKEAATLPCAGLTAGVALTRHQRGVTAGDTVLTQGSGGVSIFALQFARLLGAQVIATTSSAEKAERPKALGARP
jgi:X-Pro dipeptidyl-peptidase (S15 family)